MNSVRAWTPGQVRKLRSRLRLTQREFAARLGVTQVTVSAWETKAPKMLPRSKAKLDSLLMESEEKK